MASPNKKRFIQNLILIAVIAAIGYFLWAQKEVEKNDTRHLAPTLYDKSIGDEATQILIHVKNRADILLKNIDDVWMVVQPEEFVADKDQVRHLFTILSENAETSFDLEGKDLVQYGLDEDRISLSFNNVKLVFGEYNPVSQKRYIRKANKMYLVSETVTGLLQTGLDAFRMKEENNEITPESTNNTDE
ncbi:MAG: DUF4340 domain-containing protein [Cocleimonas sp.]